MALKGDHGALERQFAVGGQRNNPRDFTSSYIGGLILSGTDKSLEALFVSAVAANHFSGGTLGLPGAERRAKLRLVCLKQ